jgi:hypothetical protein
MALGESDMSTRASAERTVLVFCIWAGPGFLGAGGLVEGFVRDSLPIALLGIGGICAAFIAHIVVNAVFGQGFSRAETALGIGGFGLFAALFVTAWVGGELSPTDYLSGLAAFFTLAMGFLVYLSTRYGMRGAFSRFHHTAPSGNGGNGR